MAHKEEIVVV